MHVHAQPVAGAVHVEAAVGVGLDDAVDAAGEQPQIDHALREHAHRGFVRRVPGVAGRDLRDGGPCAASTSS